MRRAALLLLFATALNAAPEKWYEAYNRGVSAVNAKGYRAGAEALQKSVGEMPNEGTSVRAGKEIIVYVPHFWLGIAKFNLGDVDGALREWRISEEQGAISRTEYYSRMKDWVARAQTEKQRLAQSAASGPKKAADMAISKALAVQVDALSAGGDRSESYRAAQRKLQEALAQFHKAGTDIEGYKSAEQIAQQSVMLFSAAAEEGKKLKAARAAAPSVVRPQPPKPQPTVVQQPVAQPQQAAPQPTQAAVVPPPVKVEPPPPAPVESEAKVAASLAVQQYRRNVGAAPRAIARTESREADNLRTRLEQAKSDAEYERIANEARDRDAAMAKKIVELAAAAAQPTPVVEVATPATQELSNAYRAYAAGDLVASEQLLTRLVDAQPTPEAYLLRGCARYTRAMLSRAPDALLAGAAADFKLALQRNQSLRLDRSIFSPKLVAFFEQVRGQR